MSKFSVRKPLTIFVSVLAVIILGVVAFTRMTPDLLPNMDFPYVMIMTTYPGQSPEIVEREITRPLEQSMATLEHIKEVTSTSRENYSLVVLEFEDSVNMDTVGVDIQQSISALQGGWDETVGSPYVLKINPSLLPIAIAAVSKDDMDITELSDFLDETIIPKLEGVTGLASVSTSGSIYRQVHVVISQEKIDKVNARMADAVNGKLDDAKTELEDAKTELEDAKTELENAQTELESGQETLVDQTGAAQGTLTQQQTKLLQTRMDLQSQLSGLQSTKTTLTTTLAALQEIQNGISTLETSKTSLENQLAALPDTSEELTAVRAEVAALTESIAQLEAEILTLQTSVNRMQARYDELMAKQEEELTPDEQAELAQLEIDLPLAQADLATAETNQTLLQGQLATATARLAELTAQESETETERTRIQAQLTGVNASLAAIDSQLEAMGTSRSELPGQVTELQSNLTQVDAGITKLQDAISQIDNGTMQLSQAMAVLSQSQSSGLLQISEAATQLTVNSAAVESALTEVDAGLEQIENSRADALEKADLSGTVNMTMVSQILAAQNFSMPAGYIKQDGISYMVSVGDEMTSEDELEALLLFDTGEDGIGPVYLRDVADIFVTDNANSVYTKLNGSDSIMLTFEKQSNAATAEVSDNLQARFDELEAQYPGLEFILLMDQGDYIYLIVESIMSSLLSGALFSIIILFLFLRDLRPTVITLVAIPVSVIFAFVLMYFTGITLNMISLSGLAVAVGMLVDNSIVVIENIYRLRTKGATAVQAAVAGAKQVAGAITASTLTTVCVFLPIVFVEGIIRQMFTDLALTMTYSLMASLIIALTLVPAMAKGMLKERKKKSGKREKPRQEGVFYRAYRRIAAWNLRHKWVALGLAISLLGLTAWQALEKGFSFMPEIDMNTVNVTLSMPEDTTREEAMEWADQALERIATLENAQYVGAMMGGTSLTSMGNTMRAGDYNVSVYVGLPEGDSGAEAGEKIARLCEDLPIRTSYDSAMMNMSMLTGSGIAINIYGEDMEDLQQAARDMAEVLEDVEGVKSVSDGLEDAQDAYHVYVNRNEAMKKGLTVAQIYLELATAMTSSTTVMDMDMESVTADVIVESESGMSLDDLRGYTFDYTDSAGESGTFRLDEVADIEPTVSMSTISRIDQRRYLTVTASLEAGYNITRVTSAAEKAVAGMKLPGEVTYEFSGENETIMDAVSNLFLMLLIGIVLVYFIMVAQFQSLKSPFIVMFTIPLAFTGGFAALLIFGMDVSIVSLIGFVMLVGIIVNNGIVLVDYVNQLRESGMERREALVEAGVTRMRPIFMTSLTTILGLIVMATAQNVGTSLMQPIAVVCIGGLLYATLMTLFVVPCIYDIMNRKELVVYTEEDLEFNEV